MENSIKDKLKGIYELINRGATEGERAAAKNALDRIISRHGITDAQLADMELREYVFKYSTRLDELISIRLIHVLMPDAWQHAKKSNYKAGRPVKEIKLKLTYEQYIIFESNYEYFRRHLKAEWKRVAEPVLKRCKTAKTKTAKRKTLEPLFFNKYCIASNLYKPQELIAVKVEGMNAAEYKARSLMEDVKGGNYNRQVTGGKYITN